MSLANGESEIDTVVLNLPDYGKTIVNWSTYSLNQAFLTPTVGWTFRVSDEDTELTSKLLVPGARVNLSINGNIQCTGTIDRKKIDASDAGTTVTVQGRDILGRVLDSTTDPRFKFAAGQTILDVLLSVLKPFGISTVYNSDALNIEVISGLRRGRGRKTITVRAKVQSSVPDAEGDEEFIYDDGEQVVDPTRPDLKTITVEQFKPHLREGVFQFIDRVVRRFGFAMWAAADGSGVVVDTPDFKSPAQHKIIRKRSVTSSANNVKSGSMTVDLASQPSVIVAFGFGGGREVEKTQLKVIAINELTGLDERGQPLPEVAAILSRYKGAKVLPIRRELRPFPRPSGDQKLSSPFFLKDDEAKNLEQLEAFTRRELANRQQKALQVEYTLIGHTFDRKPWAVNTLVNVDDDVLDVHETLWVLDKTFSKSSSGGTTATVHLIRPYTLQLGA